jgi:hypothetical protein
VLFLTSNGIGNFNECPRCKHNGKHGWKKKWPIEKFDELVNDNLRLKCCGPCTGAKFTWSPFVGTFFGNSLLKKRDILRLVYFWANGITIDQTKQMTGHAENTVARHFRFLREVCVADLINRGAQNKIGGLGVVVEIDESKYGKRKYHRGHRVDGNWVFGAIERLYDWERGKYFAGRFILLVVPDRTEETLGRIIKAFIRPGSLIISDCYSSYSKIKDYEDENVIPLPHLVRYDSTGQVAKMQKMFHHQTVNHTYTYKDPITGAYTNTIEGHWRVLKCCIPKKLYADAHKLQEYLYEQQWEKIPRIQKTGKFFGMIECLQYVTFDKEKRNVSYTLIDQESLALSSKLYSNVPDSSALHWNTELS